MLKGLGQYSSTGANKTLNQINSAVWNLTAVLWIETFTAKPPQPSVFIWVEDEMLQEKPSYSSSHKEAVVANCFQALLIPARIWIFVSLTLLSHQLLSEKPCLPDIMQSFAYARLKEQPLKNSSSFRNPSVFRGWPLSQHSSPDVCCSQLKRGCRNQWFEKKSGKQLNCEQWRAYCYSCRNHCMKSLCPRIFLNTYSVGRCFGSFRNSLRFASSFN